MKSSSASSASIAGLDPLKDLLLDVISRLEALENAVGKSPSPPRGLSSRALGSSSSHHPTSGTTTTATAGKGMSFVFLFVRQMISFLSFVFCKKSFPVHLVFITKL